MHALDFTWTMIAALRLLSFGALALGVLIFAWNFVSYFAATPERSASWDWRAPGLRASSLAFIAGLALLTAAILLANLVPGRP